MKQKSVLGALVILLFLFLEGLISFSDSNNKFEKEILDILSEVVLEEQVLGDTTLTIVKRVVDGDTIQLINGDKVRYIGVDTPETVDPRKAVECFGKQASEINKELVEGKTVRLESDVSDTDRYGRKLRYVFVVDGEEEIFVNEYLIRNGFGFSSSYAPNIKYLDLFDEAQREAEVNNLGFWSDVCGVEYQ